MKRALGLLVLAALALGSVLGFTLVNVSEHDGVGVAGCPFMPTEAVVCVMSALDHAAAWRSMYTGLPGMPLAALALLVAVATFVAAPSADRTPHFFTRTAPHPVPQIQQLFSRGILHPKLDLR